jgi:hypothetical protein
VNVKYNSSHDFAAYFYILTVVTLDLATLSMEFLDLLYLTVVYILAIFVVVSSVVFVFLQQRWSLAGHGDAQQQKEKTVIFLGGQVGTLFDFAESKFREKAIIYQWRRFDLLSAAMPEKIFFILILYKY